MALQLKILHFVFCSPGLRLKVRIFEVGSNDCNFQSLWVKKSINERSKASFCQMLRYDPAFFPAGANDTDFTNEFYRKERKESR